MAGDGKGWADLSEPVVTSDSRKYIGYREGKRLPPVLVPSMMFAFLLVLSHAITTSLSFIVRLLH